MATPREITRTLGKGWFYDPKARRAYNVETGETISRRQLETKYEGGRLKEEGYSSFEAKAKARRASGLSGFRQGKSPGVYEKVINNARDRKAALRALPPGTRVSMLVYGDDPEVPDSGPTSLPVRNTWRTMNFAKRQGRAQPMRADEMLSVWDARASRAGRVIQSPRKWVLRVYRDK